MRITAVLSTVVLSAGLLAGCGSSKESGSAPTGDHYCQDLEAAKADFGSLQSGTPDFAGLGDAVHAFHELADEAPASVADDWETLDEAFATLQADLRSAGISLNDLGPLMKGTMPPGIDPADLAALGPKLRATFAKLDDAKFARAGKAIEQHAKAECHIDLVKG